MKKLWTLLFLFIYLISFSQDIILQKNYNPRVQDLKHSLNQTKDSLLLRSENSTIVTTEIFNEDYENKIQIEDLHASLPLQHLPVGSFVVEVQLSDKIVVMHLHKDEIRKPKTEFPIMETNFSADNSKTTKAQTQDGNANLYNLEYLLSGGRSKSKVQENLKYFWVLTKVNTGNKVSKSMRLEDQNTVDKLIAQHKLETKTLSAKLNELIIWEIYNKDQFMKHQMANPNYIESSSSEYFGVLPYFSSQSNIK